MVVWAEKNVKATNIGQGAKQ